MNEKPSQADVAAAYDVPAFHINNFQVLAMNGQVRIAFGENQPGVSPHYRVAVGMSVGYAEMLIGVLRQTIDQEAQNVAGQRVAAGKIN